jgi:hypothetical protein
MLSVPGRVGLGQTLRRSMSLIHLEKKNMPQYRQPKRNVSHLETFGIIKHGRFGFVEMEALARVSTIWKYRERETAKIDS